MKLKRCTIALLAVILAAGMTGCRADTGTVSSREEATMEGSVLPESEEEETEPEAEEQVESEEPLTEDLMAGERRSAYFTALQELYYDEKLPVIPNDENSLTEIEAPSYGRRMDENLYAVADVDRDGKNELVIRILSCSMAGRMSAVYEYNVDSGQYVREFYGLPEITFYENGLLKEDSALNQGSTGQGSSGTFNLYRHDGEADVYQPVSGGEGDVSGVPEIGIEWRSLSWINLDVIRFGGPSSPRNTAYLNVVRELLSAHGEPAYENNPQTGSEQMVTGLCLLKLLDFDRDGEEELLTVVYDTSKKGDDKFAVGEYIWSVYGFDGENAKLLNSQGGLYGYDGFTQILYLVEHEGKTYLCTGGADSFFRNEYYGFDKGDFTLVRSVVCEDLDADPAVVLVDGERISADSRDPYQYVEEWEEGREEYEFTNFSNSPEAADKAYNTVSDTICLLCGLDPEEEATAWQAYQGSGSGKEVGAEEEPQGPEETFFEEPEVLPPEEGEEEWIPEDTAQDTAEDAAVVSGNEVSTATASVSGRTSGSGGASWFTLGQESGSGRSSSSSSGSGSTDSGSSSRSGRPLEEVGASSGRSSSASGRSGSDSGRSSSVSGRGSSSDYILPDSSRKFLKESDLEDLSEEELRYARNELYARHGRKFNDAALQSYFDSKSWYEGTVEPEKFTLSMMNQYEVQNVKLIAEEEKKRKSTPAARR